jgi:acetyl esterase
MQTEIDPRLQSYAAEVMALAPTAASAMSTLPSPGPAEGETREEWVARVAAVRTSYEDVARVLAPHLGVPGKVPEIGAIEDHQIPVNGGTVGARVYQPLKPGPHPAVVFFHGGAWWQAGGELNHVLTDDFCKVLVDGLSAVVVSIDYRLAPEFPFPQQLEDSYAGARWVIDNAAGIDVDPARVSLFGASSGGNQAAGVCMLAQERGLDIRSLTLHVPALDLTLSSPSMCDDPGHADFVQVVRLYATDEQLTNPLVSPLFASDLSGFPPTVVVTGDHDPLRDDGSRFVHRLAEAQVLVRHLTYPMFHNVALPETTKQMLAEIVEAVRPHI